MLDKTMRKPPPLILGSTSRYRRELLENGHIVRDREWHERIPRDHQ